VVDAFAEPPGDPYAAFVRWKARDIVQYNCWHEDRTAGGNGIEARVPFLDHRLVELAASVPPERRERLLWDKRMVREAVRDVLPPVLAEREKVPFFHGEGVRYAHRTFIAMLAQDGAELVERACASPNGQRFLDRGAMLGHLADLQRDPAAGHVETLLRLVNLGLLDAMLTDLPAPPVTTGFATVPQARPVTDWAAERAEILELTLPRRPVGPADVPRLADGVELLAPLAEGTGEVVYVAVSGQIEYVVAAADDPAWLRFLRGVDGRRSVAKLLADSGDELADVRDVLLDAVEYSILDLADPAPAEG
jgi:asparagine synthase (glutamine-hydrolysing)